jgi:N-acetylmuramoyl-L-alanine amidase
VVILAIKIFIDQGHNPYGFNAGAEGNGLREQDITYSVGTALAQILEKDSRFDVRVSREMPDQVLGSDNATSLCQRVEKANTWPADYFVSVHANASTNPDANGSEVYVYSLDTAAASLAQPVLDSIVSELGTKDNGVRPNPSLYVLQKTMMPAILVELAYITNVEDAVKLRDKQQEFALAIYHGILKFFGYA